MGNRPGSVTIVAAITLASAVVVLLTFGVLEFELVLYTSEYSVMAAVALAMEIYALVVSILMFVSNSKLVWYFSVIFWVLVIAAAISFTAYVRGLFLVFYFVLPPIVSSTLCLVTFCEETVRKYFGLKREV